MKRRPLILILALAPPAGAFSPRPPRRRIPRPPPSGAPSERGRGPALRGVVDGATTNDGGGGADGDETLDVLVVGAGPTGLAAAAEAARRGLSIRVVERRSERLGLSKALVVHARTLEQLRVVGSVADRLVGEGTRMGGLNHFNGRSHERRSVRFGDVDWGDTDFPFWLSIPQYRTEMVLQEEFESLGGSVEWGANLTDLTQAEDLDCVHSTVVKSDGSEEVVRSKFVIGCDGGRSRVRDLISIEFRRQYSGARLVLVDAKLDEKTKSQFPPDQANVSFHSDGILFMLSLGKGDYFRIIADMPRHRYKKGTETDVEAEPDITDDFINDIVSRRLGKDIGAHDMAWSSIYKISYGVANVYRNGHVFIAGDAAHVHSPLGGQGMNFGLQDSLNLVWKLAWAKRAMNAHPNGSKFADLNAIFDSYSVERRTAASAMIDVNAKATEALTSRNPLVIFMREVAARILFGTKFFANRLVKATSMLGTSYTTTSPILASNTPSSESFLCASGHRVPNLLTTDGKRLYGIIDRTRHS